MFLWLKQPSLFLSDFQYRLIYPTVFRAIASQATAMPYRYQNVIMFRSPMSAFAHLVY